MDKTIQTSPAAFMVDFCNRIYVSGWGTNWMAMSNDHPRYHRHGYNK